MRCPNWLLFTSLSTILLFSIATLVLLPTTELRKHWHGKQNFVLLDCTATMTTHFFSIWQAWRCDPHRPQRLHYLILLPQLLERNAFYHLPLSVPRALRDQLHAVWPTAVSGFHRIFLEQEKVLLTLLCGDSKTCLEQLSARIDAFWLKEELGWKNWPILFSKLAAQQALLASTHLEQSSRILLQRAGFLFDTRTSQISYAHFTAGASPLSSSPSHAIVIGAGLAGSAACQRLTQRGWHVTLIETHALPAQQASGNAAGIYMPLLSQDDNPSARLSRSAYLFAQHVWHNLGGIGRAFTGQRCGVLQCARTPEEALSQQHLIATHHYPAEYVMYCDASTASRLVGWPIGGGWYFPNAGWIAPASLCQALLNDCGARLTSHFGRHVTCLEQTTQGWNVYDQDGIPIASAPFVILANAHAVRHFAQTETLPLASLRGQITYLDTHFAPAIHMVVCGAAYASPAAAGCYSIGASYDTHANPALSQQSQDDNLARLADLLPGWCKGTPPLAGRVGFRCVAPDRLPLVGAVASPEGRHEKLQEMPRVRGLHCLLGYASRGLLWAPLAAELLAAQLNQEPLPIEAKLAAALDPARFLLKQQRRSPPSKHTPHPS